MGSAREKRLDFLPSPRFPTIIILIYTFWPDARASVRAVESSSASRLETLYCDHHGWLYGWLRRKLGNTQDAADLAHDTFIRLVTSRRFHSLNDEPRALLAHIAKGLMIDHWRRQDVEAACLTACTTATRPRGCRDGP